MVADTSLGQVRMQRDESGERTRYEDLEVGRDLGTATLFVTQKDIDDQCERMEFYHPWYAVDSPFGGTIAPVRMTYPVARLQFSTVYSVRGLLYKWSFEFVNPVRSNIAYAVNVRLSNKWIKNEREFVEYEAVCQGPDGNVVFTTRRAHVLDYLKRTAPKVGDAGVDSSDGRSPDSPQSQALATMAAAAAAAKNAAPTPRPSVPASFIQVRPLASRATELGAALPSFSLPFTQARFDRYFGEGEFSRGLHYDPLAARREGLQAPAAGGPDVMVLIHNAALQFFGEGWVKGGRSDLTMRRPVTPGEFVTSKGFVKSQELLPDGSVRLVCETWIENSAGEKKTVGTISGIVR